MKKQFPSSRRDFIRKSVIAAAGIPLLTYACNDMPKTSTYFDNIGLQLYTVRDQMEADSTATLKALKEIGYQQLELMSVEGMEDYLPIIRDLGMDVNGAFFNWNFLTNNWSMIGREAPVNFTFDNVLENAVKEKFEYLVFGYLTKEERSTIDDWKQIIEDLNKTGEKCKEAGIQLTYHNHSFEFGSVEGQVPFELLVEGLDPELVKFELDIFWASIGGYDPVSTIKRLGKRVHLLHLKDLKKDTPVIFDEGAVPVEAFKELGNGVVDIKACLAAAETAGVAHCHVEQDQSSNPLGSVEESWKWMKEHA